VVGERLHADEVEVDEELLQRLLADQHPDLADLEVRRIPSTGTDHAVFRLGDRLVVRMPRIGWAEQQVERERVWLPELAPALPVAIPTPVAVGQPGRGYPFRWLVSPWIEGRDLLAVLAGGDELDQPDLARSLAAFLRALQSIDGDGGPVPGKRGRQLGAHDDRVRRGIAGLADEIDAERALELWAAALAAPPWAGPPVWVHGDLLPGNVVVHGGRLASVIDWSATGVGDPACELMVAWSLADDARMVLRGELDVDDATWTRARGWVIEQAVAFIPYYERTLPEAVAHTRGRLAACLADRP
jgi:aminoglycoside phosphotransferase (APT) family kinase protein